MVVKMLGMALVLGSTALAGVYFGSLESFRAADLLELKKALSILRSEIEFARTGLPEALASIGRRTSRPVGAMFTRLEELVCAERGAELAELWERSVAECVGKTYLSAEDREQLLSFGKTLGYLDAGMQLMNITLLTDYISGKVAALNENRYKSRRMYQGLGVLVGLLIIVIFI